MKSHILIFLVTVSSVTIAKNHERNFKNNVNKVIHRQRLTRSLAEDTAADVMARNILEWIQGLYRQGSRKPRQQSENAYLPPYSTQRPPEKPRPFQSTTNTIQSYPSPNINEINAGVQRPSTSFSPPANGYASNKPFPPFSTSSASPYSPSSQSFPTSSAPKPFSPASSTTYLPPRPTPGQPENFPDYNYPSPEVKPQPSFSTPQSGGSPAPNQGGFVSSGSSSTTGEVPGTSAKPVTAPSGTSVPSVLEREPTESGDGSERNGVDAKLPEDDDLKHPPHIHAIDVECSKAMMTINIEFNRQFDGLIYSKGFYMNPECRYVEPNSGQKNYKFTVNLDSCGTQFINDFEGEAGQAYLENVLVLQNEPGIQEIWDTVRSVRCLWEGNINKALTVTLSVDMLNQEIVTFSGDTASAKLDIQIGKGPFAPAANGLVKIGETMTLVVSVEGDPGFDLHVRDCIARDESSNNVVRLTDERGCILKPKFFGAFQKTRDTGNSGASIIAYAFFQAFKFPDVMDLFIECNVELCKTDCEGCPDPNQQVDPGRRRRSVITSFVTNSSMNVASNPVKVIRGFKVIMPEDLTFASTEALRDITDAFTNDVASDNHVCLCNGSFYAAFSLMFVALALTAITAAILYAKLHRIYTSKYEFSRKT